MDPSDADLAGLDTLEKVRDWTGTADAAGNILIRDLGSPLLRREVCLIPAEAWDTTVTAFEIAKNIQNGVAVCLYLSR